MTTAVDDTGGVGVAALLGQDETMTEDGFAVLYRHYKPDLVRHAANRGATDPEGVADLALHDGFRALGRLENLTAGSFRGYMLQAVNGHVVAEYRRSDRAEPIHIDPDAISLADPTDTAVESAWLRELVDDLPPAQRDVIHSRFYLGLSGGETAARLGKDANAVYQLQHRAVERLRRAIFGGLVVILAALAVLAVREMVSSSTQIDSSPADRNPNESAPTPDVEPTPTQSIPEAVAETLEADATGAARIEADVSPAPPGDPETGDPAVPDPSGTAPSTTVQSDAEPTGDAEAAPLITDEAPTASTTPISETVPDIAVNGPATAPNVCAPHLASDSLYAFKLFSPGSNHNQAAEFNPPAAIRFLDRTGGVIQEVSTAGPFTTGRSGALHGWIGAGDGTGTYANFDEAPTPTYWGVLVDEVDVRGWAETQWLDGATGTWTTVSGCN